MIVVCRQFIAARATSLLPLKTLSFATTSNVSHPVKFNHSSFDIASIMEDKAAYLQAPTSHQTKNLLNF